MRTTPVCFALVVIVIVIVVVVVAPVAAPVAAYIGSDQIQRVSENQSHVLLEGIPILRSPVVNCKTRSECLQPNSFQETVKITEMDGFGFHSDVRKCDHATMRMRMCVATRLRVPSLRSVFKQIHFNKQREWMVTTDSIVLCANASMRMRMRVATRHRVPSLRYRCHGRKKRRRLVVPRGHKHMHRISIFVCCCFPHPFFFAYFLVRTAKEKETWVFPSNFGLAFVQKVYNMSHHLAIVMEKVSDRGCRTWLWWWWWWW